MLLRNLLSHFCHYCREGRNGLPHSATPPIIFVFWGTTYLRGKFDAFLCVLGVFLVIEFAIWDSGGKILPQQIAGFITLGPDNK